ncbi:MAG: hypothetical protein V3W14_07905 [Candidatus Neomarinimicrobiota bacterium]
MSDKPAIKYNYTFSFPDGQEIACPVELDPDSLEYRPPANQTIPAWARSEDWPCVECDLANKRHGHCRVVRNIAVIVEQFRDVASFDIADVTVESDQRTYSRRQIPVQDALSSLLGLILTTSGCTVLDLLRPMARLHLPFASVEETTLRAVSTYLLAQYFRLKHGLSVDWNLDGLLEIYRRIGAININVCEQLRTAVSQDASLNAVIVLDTFAQMLHGSIETEMAQFERLFAAHMTDRD